MKLNIITIIAIILYIVPAGIVLRRSLINVHDALAEERKYLQILASQESTYEHWGKTFYPITFLSMFFSLIWAFVPVANLAIAVYWIMSTPVNDIPDAAKEKLGLLERSFDHTPIVHLCKDEPPPPGDE